MHELKQKMDAALERLKSDVASLRTGRATPALVEDLEIEHYGAKTPLKAVASISAPDARQLVIQPWDKGAIPAIESAIVKSSLGLAPITDRDAIRLSIPMLTEERRGELTKFLHRHAEDARIRVRQEREEVLREIDRRHKAGEISEDQRFRDRAEVQKIVDEYNKKIEDLATTKEKDMMSI